MRRRFVALLAAVVVAGCAGEPAEPEAPADPLRPLQWSLDLLDPDDELADLSTGAGVTVAVVDSGVDSANPDLGDRVLEGRDFIDPGTPPDDEYGHGTHVAGLIAAQASNGIDIAGLAPEVQILPVRVLDQRGDGELDDVAAGIRWATQQGVEVINVSIEATTNDPELESAIAEAVAANIVVVAAGGNQPCPDVGANDPVYPASYPGVIAVAPHSEDLAPYSVSSCGSWIDLAAPGVGIVSIAGKLQPQADCEADPAVCILTGSSEAAPFVSAAAALRIAQVGPENYSAETIADELVATAVDVDPPGRDDATGAGRLDLLAVLQSGN